VQVIFGIQVEYCTFPDIPSGS